MQQTRPTRSLTRMSWIVLAIVLVLVLVYFLTHGFGAPAPVRP